MVFNEDAQLAEGIIHFTQTLLQSLEHTPKTIVLNEKKKFFLRLAIVIKPREADVGCARDVAHGSGMVIFLGKNASSVPENKLQLLIVARNVCGEVR